VHVHDNDLRLLAQPLDLAPAQLEGVVARAVHEDAAAQVQGRDRNARALAVADVRAAARLAGGVVQRPEQLGDQVDDPQ
jgi:hypothetical protein